MANSPRRRKMEGRILIGLVLLAVGALLGGCMDAATSRYATFKEAQGIAGALQTELVAIAALVRLRNYLGSIDEIIARLQQPGYQPTIKDFFSPRVQQPYFRVYSSAGSKIGLLGEASASTVRAYMLAQSLIEDLERLGDERRRVEQHQAVAGREGLLLGILELRGVLDAALASADEADRALADFRTSWWISPRRWARKVWKALR
jgi:hypothetical protein